MSDRSDRIVKKLWSYCQVLRDDGLSYQDYLEQLTFLLFLKMADERAALTGEPQAIPTGFRWADLANPKMEGVMLEQHYRDALRKLGEQGGMLGLIFSKAQNKIQDPAKLRKLVVDLIGNESWLEMSADVKGDAYEGSNVTPRTRRAARGNTSRQDPSSMPSWTACARSPGRSSPIRLVGPAAFFSQLTPTSRLTSSSTKTRSATSATTPCVGWNSSTASLACAR